MKKGILFFAVITAFLLGNANADIRAASAFHNVALSGETVGHRQQEAIIGYQDFSTGERLGTWALNLIIPGLGSGVIMRDGVGTATQVFLCLFGSVLFSTGISSGSDDMFLVMFGGGLLVTNLVYNTYRSVNHLKPIRGRQFSDNIRGNFNFAVFPNRHGDVGTALVYNMEF